MKNKKTNASNLKKEFIRKWWEFKCHQHDETDYDVKIWVKKNHVWEEFESITVVWKCGCEFSIDYLFTHQTKTFNHTR